MNAKEIAFTIIKDCCGRIRSRKHYINFEPPTIWYSRYFSGGSFESAMVADVIERDLVIVLRPRAKFIAEQKFEIADPDISEKITKFIRVVINHMQNDRKPL